MTSTQTQIRVAYTAIDGARETRSFKTLKGARAFAVRYVGAHPEFGSHYAVSADGIGKVTVSGCDLHRLFSDGPTEAEIEAQQERDIELDAAARAAGFHSHATREAELAAYAAEAAEIRKAYAPKREAGCTCSDAQLDHVGCDCLASWPF